MEIDAVDKQRESLEQQSEPPRKEDEMKPQDQAAEILASIMSLAKGKGKGKSGGKGGYGG